MNVRVISGNCKGTRLKAVPGKDTRPTTDKVKESLFNIIGPYFDGGEVLDLFSGSGGLGIEALSRGMDHGVFIDRSYKAIRIVKDNVKACHLEGQADIYKNDALKALPLLQKRKAKFDLIFLDPPYASDVSESLLETIINLELCAQDGMIVVEHDVEKEWVVPQTSGLTIRNRTSYGNIALTVYVLNSEGYQ